MLGTVLERVVAEGADGIEVRAAGVCTRIIYGKTDGEPADQQHAKRGLMCESSLHSVSSRILGLRFPEAT